MAWSRQSGPGTVAFADASAPVTTATFSAPGDYVLQVSADNGSGKAVSTLAVKVELPPPARPLTPVDTAFHTVTGAFWANQVKGTYWNWDPVEVWSLISWLIYGIYLHLRITFGWRGPRLAVYSLAALVVMIVSYWGIPFTMSTFHEGFRIEH